MDITKGTQLNKSISFPQVSKSGTNNLSSSDLLFGTSPNTKSSFYVMEHKTNLPGTNHRILLGWVEKIRQHCRPSRVHWCTGSQEEYDQLCNELVNSGTFLRLKESATRGPNCFLARYIFRFS